MMASGFPISGARPKFDEQARERGTGDAVATNKAGEDARDGALARSQRADNEQDLLLAVSGARV